MIEVTATEASRSFADLLDGVEHRGERYTIVRRGRVIAQLEPATPVSGADTKALLRPHRLDAASAVATGRTVATDDHAGFDDLPGVDVRRPV